MINTTNLAADAELIRLGDQLAIAIAAERQAVAALDASGQIDNDGALNAVCAPVSAIVKAMRYHRPSTVAGFAAIQLAIAWVHGSLPVDIEDFNNR